LDPTFGAAGLAARDVGFSSTDGVARQPNGQSVIVGTSGSGSTQAFGLTRYNADGSLDTSFGTNGVANASFGGSSNAAGKGLDFPIAAYNADGSPDASFGSSGTASLRSIVRSIKARQLFPRPDFKLANVGGAFLPRLNSRWGDSSTPKGESTDTRP
jgi:uncharacterized delta-60 repeat protein